MKLTRVLHSRIIVACEWFAVIVFSSSFKCSLVNFVRSTFGIQSSFQSDPLDFLRFSWKSGEIASLVYLFNIALLTFAAILSKKYCKVFSSKFAMLYYTR